MNDRAVNPIIKDFVRIQSDIKIDRYSNKGGFGELYFGTKIILGDRVALKFYQLDPSGSGHEEPQLLQQIKHPNILDIYDARILATDIAYYLTPEISGGDLQNVIENYIVSTSMAITIMQDILKGLTELHKNPRNLVHRDLKTGNILIDNNDGKAFVADFGTIMKIPDGVDNVAASRYTFIYRPPEVIRRNTYYKQSDIYQLGIVLFQVLGGYFPLKNIEDWLQGRAKLKYSTLNPFDKQVFIKNYLEDIILKGKLINCDTLPIFINKKLRTIIKTATNIDYNRRFQSCAEFLKALFDYQKDSKDWWVQTDIIHAYCKKTKQAYRVVQRGKELIAEASKDSINWRKKKGDTKLKAIVDFIEHN